MTSQTMQFVNYASAIPGTVSISGSGNPNLTSVSVSIDPSLSGTSTPVTGTTWLASNDADGQYGKPTAAVGISNAEFSDLFHNLQNNNVTHVEVFYGPPGANGKSPISKFEFQRLTLAMQISALETRVDAVEEKFEGLEKRFGVFDERLKNLEKLNGHTVAPVNSRSSATAQ